MYSVRVSANVSMLIVRFVEFYRFVRLSEIRTHHQQWPIPEYIQSVLDRCWWSEKPNFHSTLKLLNSGDCAVVAMAVAEKLRMDGVTDIQFHNNGGHYYFSIGVTHRTRVMEHLTVNTGAPGSVAEDLSKRLYFDSFFPGGVEHATELLQHPNPEIRRNDSGDAEWFAEQAFPDDHYGKEFVEQFVKFYHPDYVYPYAISGRQSEVYYGL